MPQQQLAVAFTTEGFQQAIANMRSAQVEFDKSLQSTAKAVEAAIAGQKAAIAGGDINAAAEFSKQLETGVKRSQAIIAQSYRELGIQSETSLNRQKEQAISAYNAIAGSGVASARDIASAQTVLGAKLTQINRQLGETAQSAERAGGKFTIMGGIIASTLGNLAASGIQSIISGILGLQNAVIQTGTTAERQKVAFETFTGSAEAAAKVMKQVREFAATTPFELPEVTNAAKQLLAVRVPVDELIPTIKRLGEIAAGADKPLSQLLFVYGQIKNQGRALGQDINQLLNAGLSMDDIAKALGKSSKEMGEMKSSSKGLQLSFEDVDKVIKSVTSEGGRFYGLMDKLGSTTAVKLSNVNDAFTKIYQAIYNGISPALGAVLDAIIKIIDPIGENVNLFKGLTAEGERFKKFLEQNPAIINAIRQSLQDGVETTLNVIVDLAKSLGSVLAENPKLIADAVTAMGTLIKAVGWLIDKLIVAVNWWGKLAAGAVDLLTPGWEERQKQRALKERADNTPSTNVAGKVLGYTGNTGDSSGPHLHFEVRQSPGGPLVSEQRRKELESEFIVGKEPLTKRTLTSPVGMRMHPTQGVRKMHNGDDFSAPVGTPISFGGDVSAIRYVPNNGGAGNTVEILLPTGELVRLMHLDRPGDIVKQGIVGLREAANQAGKQTQKAAETKPGDMTPDGKKALKEWEEKVDKLLDKYKSPLTAKDFLNASEKSGVSPDLLLTMAMAESNFGTIGRRSLETQNPLNIGNTDNGKNRYFSSFGEGLTAAATALRRDWGITNLDEFAANKFRRPDTGGIYATRQDYESYLRGIQKSVLSQVGSFPVAGQNQLTPAAIASTGFELQREQQKKADQLAEAARQRANERQQQAAQEQLQRLKEAFDYKQRTFDLETQQLLAENQKAIAVAADKTQQEQLKRQREQINADRNRAKQDAQQEFDLQRKILEYQQSIAVLDQERTEKLLKQKRGEPVTGKDLTAQINLIQDQIKWLEASNNVQRETLAIHRQQEDSLKRQAEYQEKAKQIASLFEIKQKEALQLQENIERSTKLQKEQADKATAAITAGGFTIREMQLKRDENLLNPFARAELQQQLAMDKENARYKASQENIKREYYLNPELRDKLLGQAQAINQLNLGEIDSQFKDLGETIQDVTKNALQSFFDAFIQGGDMAKATLNVLTSALSNLASQFVAGGLNQLFGGLFGGAGGAIASAIPGFADGGMVVGPGSFTSDSILARLSHGEFVLNARAAQSVGYGNLDRINAGGHYAGGSGVTINNTFVTPDADSFRATSAQRDRELTRSLEIARGRRG